MSITRVLLIEDNPADAMLVQEALTKQAMNCDVLVMDDGEKALQLIQGIDSDPSTPAPELVLLDLHLPRYDGAEIIRIIRSSKRCAGSAVIVMSSSDSPKDRANAKEYSATYFVKPMTLDAYMELGKIAKNALERRGPG